MIKLGPPLWLFLFAFKEKFGPGELLDIIREARLLSNACMLLEWMHVIIWAWVFTFRCAPLHYPFLI